MAQANITPERIANVEQEMASVQKAIERKIQQKDKSATGFVHELVVDKFVECSIYYSEYNSRGEDKDDCFFYALHDGNSNEVILYDDGIDAIKRLKEKLDSRRNILQRINEFSLFELIMVALAFSSMFVFLVTCAYKTPPQELTGIVGIIVGYYFAKAKS